MYLKFYGLKARPFPLVPDSAFLFKSSAHSRACQQVLYGLSAGEAIVLLTGDAGTGKTALCRAMIHELRPSMEAVFIGTPPASPGELLRAILKEFGVQTVPVEKAELRDRLQDQLVRRAGEGRGVVIFLDEAQDLSEQVLEEIRLLSNLAAEGRQLLQMVLAGQPEILQKLTGNGLQHLCQRIGIHYHLNPLHKNELERYIKCRLMKAGSQGDILFTRSALHSIYRHTHGIPRLVHHVCDKALLAGYVAQQMSITGNMVREAIKSTYGGSPAVHKRQMKLSYGMAGAAAGLALLCALGLSWNELMQRHESYAISPPPQHEKPARAAEAAPSEGGQLPAGPDASHPAAFDADGIMRSSPDIQSAGESLATILRLWGITDDVLAEAAARWRLSRTFSFADNAAEFKLRVTALRLSLEQIRRLDYPCIAPINEGRCRYVVLAGLDAAAVKLLDPHKGKRVLSFEEFQRIWDGRSFYVWRDLQLLPDSLKPGNAQKEILEIKKGCEALGLSPGSSGNTLYDSDLGKAITSLQAHYGLEADGIWNSPTKLAFYRALHPVELPSLHF